MIEPFMAFGDAVELVAIEAGAGPDQVRHWMVTLMRSNAVRLRDATGEMRYKDTPQAAAAVTSARAAMRQQPAARYNPHSRSRGERPTPAARPAALPGHAVMLASYSVHLGDLEKAIAREFDVRLSLCKSAPAPMRTMPATTGRPIEDVLAFLKTNGRDPECDGFSRDLWMGAATKRGIVFEPRHFDAAWEFAKEGGYVAPLKGAPKKVLQAKRMDDAASGSDASRVDAVARQKAGGA